MTFRFPALAAFGSIILAMSAGAAVQRWIDPPSRMAFDRTTMRSAKLETTVVVPTAPADTGAPVDAGARVRLYTTGWCGYCKKARAYLRSRHIPFEDIDVETTERGRREFREIGGNGVPVIFVGDRRMDGYDQGELQALLKAAGW